jgi:CubicO group peptidase (beta-lactamase class C family)
MLRRYLAIGLLLLISGGLSAQTADPSTSGFSAERLQRIGQMIDRHIAAKDIPGAVTLVARNGRIVHFEARGLADLETKTPLTKDTVFELFSMTKPVVATAILILAEEGRLHLNDPIGNFVPEYQRLNVTVVAPQTEPANRPITIRDVLTHTSGLASGTTAVAGTDTAVALADRTFPRQPTDTLADYVPRLAVAPLRFQPGTRWAYSGILGFDLLARVVEVVSGQSFDEFLRQRIFLPLGMTDTAHNLNASQTRRLATRYQVTPEGLRVLRSPYTERYFGGGWGLKGTAENYFHFAQMLVNNGEFNGKRILSPRSVELMSGVSIPSSLPGRPSGEGYGLGVRVVSDAAARGTWLSEGAYGWQGAAGTVFFIDPQQAIVAIALAHASLPRLLPQFEQVVMQALVEDQVNTVRTVSSR